MTSIGTPHTSRSAAITIGVLFIMASASAILGVLLYAPIMGPDYMLGAAQYTNQIVLGAIMELTVVVTAIGTAIGLFPVLRRYGERVALAHLSFRFLEAVVIAVGVVAVLSLVTLGQQSTAASGADAAVYRISGDLMLTVREWTIVLGPLLFLGINTLMYSSLLFKSKLVPRPLATLGIVGATLVTLAAFLALFEIAAPFTTVSALLCAPIAVYEMILAGWLIVKGFNPAAAAAFQPTPTSTRELQTAAA